MSNKTALTIAERVAKAREAEQRTMRSILKDELRGNTTFAAVNDTRKRIGRYQRECESYLNEEGMAKHRARIQARIDRANEDMELLNEKVEVARAALPIIASHAEGIDASLQTLGAALSGRIDSVALDEDGALTNLANEAVEAANFGDLPEVVDPFEQYRAANRNAETEEDESNED